MGWLKKQNDMKSKSSIAYFVIQIGAKISILQTDAGHKITNHKAIAHNYGKELYDNEGMGKRNSITYYSAGQTDFNVHTKMLSAYFA